MIEGMVAPLLALVATGAAFSVAVAVYRRTGALVLNPVLVSTLLLIGALLALGIPYAAYEPGGRILTFFLGPVVVALGVPLHMEMPGLVRRGRAIGISLVAGSVVGCLASVGITALLGASPGVARSMVAKSVTTPIAIEITRRAGGIPDLTQAALIASGVLGAVIGVPLLRALGVRSRTALGLALGAASHAIGTVRAVEEGRSAAASAGLAIGLMGIATALVAPPVLVFLDWVGILGGP